MPEVNIRRVSPHDMEQRVMWLVERFYADVEAGKYRVGDTLPGMRELEELYGAPYTVARKFYAYLKKNGRIVTSARKGAVLTDRQTAVLPGEALRRQGIVIIGGIHWEHDRARLNPISQALLTIEDNCAKNGIPVRFFNIYESLESDGVARTLAMDEASVASYAAALAACGAVGGVILPGSPEFSKLLAKIAQQLLFPLISVGWLDKSVPAVLADEEEMGRLAVRHLADYGHRKIAGLVYEVKHEWMRERMKGMLAEAKRRGDVKIQMYRLPYPAVHGEFEAVLRPVLFELLPQIHRCATAAVCASDVLGKLTLDYENMQNVPEAARLALVTFDDDWDFRRYDMTAIRRADARQAEEAFAELVKRIVAPNNTSTDRPVKVAGKLYVRVALRGSSS